MNKSCLLPLLLLPVTAFLTNAQDRDFLTPNEIEQIREAQDPNDRLLLYVHFAKQRMDLLGQYLEKDKAGRSIFIHNTLEDYSKIIEAIDSVSDDSLRHHLAIDKGTAAVVDAEKEFLTKLHRVEDDNPRDLDRYKFVLDDAIDTTTDSQSLSASDLNKREGDLKAADTREEKDREASMSKQEKSERQQSAAAEDDKKKKIPSLYRPGEKKPDGNSR